MPPQCYNGALSTAHAHIKAGTLIGLAVTGETRWHDLPDVPTMLDAGYKDFILDNDVALSAPAKTPQAIVKNLEKATLAALNNRQCGTGCSSRGSKSRRATARRTWRESGAKSPCTSRSSAMQE